MNEALSKAIEALNAVIGYPESRQHLGAIIHDQAREALSAILTLQEARPVAFHIGNPDGTMSGLGAIYRTRHSAEYHIASYDGKLDAAIVPLYAHPQPAQQDARDAIAEAVARKTVEDFKAALWKVPNFADRVNKQTREKLSEAHSIILNLPAFIDAALSAAKEKQ